MLCFSFSVNYPMPKIVSHVKISGELLKCESTNSPLDACLAPEVLTSLRSK